jgi:hypothetical protein
MVLVQSLRRTPETGTLVVEVRPARRMTGRDHTARSERSGIAVADVIRRRRASASDRAERGVRRDVGGRAVVVR